MPGNDELFDAIKEGNLEAFEAALSETDPNARRGGDGEYALSYAASRERAAMVRLLLAAGATVDVEQPGSRTALHNAAWHWNDDIVEALIAAGADVNAADKQNWTPIFLTDRYEQFEALLRHGANVDVVATDGETLLRRMCLATVSSAQEDGVKILEKLAELGLLVADEELDGFGHTLLMEVIERGGRGRNAVAHFLIDAGMDPLVASPVGVTALHYACESANLDMVNTLLAAGADPNARVTEEWYNFEEGARPLDMTKTYASTYEAIKQALAAAGQTKATANIPNAIVGNKVVIDVDTDNLSGAMDALLNITADIKANVHKHPDYSDGDGNLEFRFDVADDEGALEELDFFLACADVVALRPKLQQYVSQIVAFNDERGLEPIYVHEEQEAGGLAIEALLRTEDPTYLPLFLSYLKSIDVDHTVHLYELMDTVRDAYSEAQLAEIVEFLEEQGFEG